MREIVAFVDEGLGNSSYLVDVGGGRGLVVDPARDPFPYLSAAERRGLRIAYAAETHLHADFVSGARELAAEGAELLAAADGSLEFPHRGLADGDEVDLGGLTLRAVATPGHTPEHMAYILLDGSRPLGAFTGGSLLVGSVARTDLISPERTDPLARAAYRSVRERLGVLPDDLPVYPTHGAGSFCSVPGGADRTTTIGRERAANPVFTASDEGSFVTTALEDLGTFPSYFLRLRTVNRRGPAVYGDRLPTLAPLGVDDVRRLTGGAALVVDVRPVPDFAAGHVPGALSIELRPAFATWLGWLVPDDAPLVFVLGSDQDRRELVRECLKVGYERLAGEIGMDAWRHAAMPEATVRIADAGSVAGTLVDVRQRSEAAEGRIPGSVHVELGDLARASLPPGPLTLHCGHGQRAMTGASLLERAGRRDLAVLPGGPEDWSRETGTPLETNR